ncbi:MAG TPA: FAD-dependent thymidylate synthase [Planctomycetota bacterium]|nr:FAD-dependent thymidylate synthase [Planctomycetota bacterium]
MPDLLEGLNREIKIGDYGIVRLIDCMPRLVEPGETFDHAVCQAARVSYGNDTKKSSEAVNRGLIRYLMRHHHGTPFEMVDIKFYMSLPIFVARQLIRHRTASINEYSMRYKQPKERFFVPDLANVRKQSKNNKQGSEGMVEIATAEKFIAYTEQVAAESYKNYQVYEDEGIGREIARINLPLSTFTEWYWEIDLRNLLGFLGLRMDPHAQKEIRDFAEACYQLTKPLAPYTFEAFEDFQINAMYLTALDVEAIRTGKPLPERATDRERDEFVTKCERLGLKDLAKIAAPAPKK